MIVYIYIHIRICICIYIYRLLIIHHVDHELSLGAQKPTYT